MKRKTFKIQAVNVRKTLLFILLFSVIGFLEINCCWCGFTDLYIALTIDFALIFVLRNVERTSLESLCLKVKEIL